MRPGNEARVSWSLGMRLECHGTWNEARVPWNLGECHEPGNEARVLWVRIDDLKKKINSYHSISDQGEEKEWRGSFGLQTWVLGFPSEECQGDGSFHILVTIYGRCNASNYL